MLRRILIVAIVFSSVPSWGATGDSCSAMFESIHQLSEKPAAPPILSFEPWNRPGTDSNLSEFSRREITNWLHESYGDAFVREIYEGGGEISVQKIDYEQLAAQKNIRKGKKTAALFLQDSAGLNYVRPADARDMELIRESYSSENVRETFQARVHTSVGELSQTAILRSKGDSEFEVEGEQFLPELQSLVRTSKLRSSRLGVALAWLGLQKAGFVELVHSHPIDAYQARFKVKGLNLPQERLFTLSEEDRETARILSKLNPKIPFLITAVVPNGFKYSALFVAGRDVTSAIERFLP
jgi:hypothetical protein